MLIGGIQKFSLLDYPDHIAAIVFTQGCNFRCHFCYNPMLVLPPIEVGELKIKPSGETKKTDGKIRKVYPQFPVDDLFDFLKNRQKKIDAVVVSGGEPTLHSDLPDFFKKIKALGFKTKLDTNGTNPGMLENLLSLALLDYIAMDIKGALDKYDIITETQPNLVAIKQSIEIIKTSGLPYEFRTTLVPELIEKRDIKKIGGLIKGAEKWYLQEFKSDMDLLNDRFQGLAGFSRVDMEEMRRIGEAYVKFCGLR